MEGLDDDSVDARVSSERRCWDLSTSVKSESRGAWGMGYGAWERRGASCLCTSLAQHAFSSGLASDTEVRTWEGLDSSDTPSEADTGRLRRRDTTTCEHTSTVTGLVCR